MYLYFCNICYVYLLGGMKSQETFFAVALHNLNDRGQELWQVADSHVAFNNQVSSIARVDMRLEYLLRMQPLL